jgi:uncharacterized protein
MIEFDPDKDAANIAKHGVSLILANRIRLDDAVIVVDGRKDYGEVRYNAFAEVDGRTLAFTFTYRDDVIRAISLRPCRIKEYRRALRVSASGKSER